MSTGHMELGALTATAAALSAHRPGDSAGGRLVQDGVAAQSRNRSSSPSHCPDSPPAILQFIEGETGDRVPGHDGKGVCWGKERPSSARGSGGEGVCHGLEQGWELSRDARASEAGPGVTLLLSLSRVLCCLLLCPLSGNWGSLHCCPLTLGVWGVGSSGAILMGL